MSNYMKRLPLMRRPPRIPDPGEMVDLRLEDGSWRQGYRALSEPSTAETGDVVWICPEDEYRKARWENREAVGVRGPWSGCACLPVNPGACPIGRAKGGLAPKRPRRSLGQAHDLADIAAQLGSLKGEATSGSPLRDPKPWGPWALPGECSRGFGGREYPGDVSLPGFEDDHWDLPGGPLLVAGILLSIG